jgi:hypothetical protein
MTGDTIAYLRLRSSVAFWDGTGVVWPRDRVPIRKLVGGLRGELHHLLRVVGGMNRCSAAFDR